jgi:hypothetical protein
MPLLHLAESSFGADFSAVRREKVVTRPVAHDAIGEKSILAQRNLGEPRSGQQSPVDVTCWHVYFDG